MTSARDVADAIRDALTEDNLTVPLKAILAATLMCARGGSPTRSGMAKVGDYSYGSSQNHYADLLDALVERMPSVVARMAQDLRDPVANAQLRSDLRARDETIAALRARNAALAHRNEQLRRYALAAHEDLRAFREQEAADTSATVRHLHPVE